MPRLSRNPPDRITDRAQIRLFALNGSPSAATIRPGKGVRDALERSGR